MVRQAKASSVYENTGFHQLHLEAAECWDRGICFVAVGDCVAFEISFPCLLKGWGSVVTEDVHGPDVGTVSAT